MQKSDRKNLTKSLLEIKDKLQHYHCTNYEGYCELYNVLSEYDLLEYVNDFLDIETAEWMAKDQLESGGLARLYYFMGDVNWNTAEIIRIDGYGNCEEVCSDDLIDIIDDVLSYEGYNDEK